ncbi:MAG: GAF domain-containing protein [Syntrophales bacterium]|nr:GAF domain-containing protein [Syntrophales bacterium]
MKRNSHQLSNFANTADTAVLVRLHEAELLLSISRTLATFEQLDEMLNYLLKVTTNEIGADRGTIFLEDTETGELYSYIAQGDLRSEIRIPRDSGIAGYVFTSGKAVIVSNAYKDPRFNRTVDEKTGYKTKDILCVPIRTMKGKLLGVAQMLNKKDGKFSRKDMQLLMAMTSQAAIVLESFDVIVRMQKVRNQEMAFYELVSSITAEIELGNLLKKVMSEATKMLNAERSTLFLNDEKRGELFSKIGEGLGSIEIRFPNNMGIAGAVFTSGETINIPYAYADLRFNPAFDKQTGFFTRSILCIPVVNKAGKIIGVTQVLNKRGGHFTKDDEARLRAFTAQIAIALENAKLFNDIQNMKNYSDSMLESMSNGVITLDENRKIVTCNQAALSMFGITPADILNKRADEFFSESNQWIMERVRFVEETRKTDSQIDVVLRTEKATISANLTICPLTSVEGKHLGTMIVIDDISAEKRMKTTMSRYMDPILAGQILESSEDILGGKNMLATILFSDIRQFTAMSEALGPQGTVSLLNEYFTLMVECIQKEGGMLDKFIGDAIMAAFGVPIPHEDDEDRAVRAAIAMVKTLDEWNKERIKRGEKPVQIGIGLNTDIVVSGNIGSPRRMDYTLIGDGVNLASRLEGLCKKYYARILLSEHTYRRLKGTYRIREVDRVVVKGKSETVGVFEVLDYHTENSFPNMMNAIAYFHDGLKLYRKKAWDKAIDAFAEASHLVPTDQLSRVYIDRCLYFKQHPPGEDWDGIWIMDDK